MRWKTGGQQRAKGDPGIETGIDDSIEGLKTGEGTQMKSTGGKGVDLDGMGQGRCGYGWMVG